jgi:hypothetical protein
LVLLESIEASQVALLALTGRLVIWVFHTLSAGKAGHLVPGRIVPVDAATAEGAAIVKAPPTIAAHSVTTAFEEHRVDRPDIFGW